MASPRTSIRNVINQAGGFTLIELLVVIGTIALFIGVSLFVDVNNYKGQAFRSEEATLVTLLQTARANALNNIDQQPQGVAIFPADQPNSYVLFEGTSYSASDPATRQVFDSQYAFSFSGGTPSEIIFSQLSGNSSFEGDIVMNDAERGLSLTISINKEGRIDS